MSTTSISANSSTVNGNMFRHYLTSPRIFLCSTCHCHLAAQEDLISKSFQGRHGRAYLFNIAVNTIFGPKEERTLITGVHIVTDVFCSGCRTLIGWKYEAASDPSQQYKVGKFIIEKAKVVKDNGWT